MQSTLTPEETDPHDIFVIEPDVVLAARVDQPPAEKPSQEKANPVSREASPVEDIMGDILSRPSTPKLRVVPDISVAAPAGPAKAVPPAKPARPVDTTFRATAATADAIANEIKIPSDIHLGGVQPSRGAWAKRAAIGFLFALGSVAAAEGWDHYGDTARQMIAEWTPALALPASQPAPTTAAAAAQPAAPAVQAAVTDQTPSPPAPAALQPAQDTAAATPDQTQKLASMTQDLAAMGQQIEALKASIAELKAGQEQMVQQIQRDIVKNAVARTEARTEARTPEPHGRFSALPPRPVRKPLHTTYYPPPPGGAMNPPPYPAPPPMAAPMPAQPLADVEAPDGGPVVRPPMPLH